MVSKDKWIIVPNSHEAIIDEETFQKVQQYRSENKKERDKRYKRKVRNKHENVLSGYMYCGVCGRKMLRSSTARNGKAEYAYYCNTARMKSTSVCTTSQVAERKVFDTILSCIKKHIETSLEMDRLLEKLQKEVMKTGKYKTICEKLTEEQEECRRTLTLKAFAYEDYRAGLFTRDEYMQAKEKYSKKVEKLEERISEDSNRKKLFEDNLYRRKYWANQWKIFKDRKDVTREMVETFIRKIEMYPDHRMKISFQYEEEYKSVMESIKEIQELEGGFDGEVSGGVS